MKPTRFELVVLIIAAAIIVYVNFVPPLVGVADSGDFGRVLSRTGLQHVSDNRDDRYFFYFNSKYRIVPRLPDEAVFEPYTSSALPVVRLARWLSIRAGYTEIFDIRVVAALWAFIFLFGLWLVLAAARSLKLGLRMLLATLLVLIFTNAGYIAYFNSFYCEQTAMCFLFVAVGCGLVLAVHRPEDAKQRMALLIGYFVFAGLAATAKPQYAPLAWLLAAFGVYLATVTKTAKWWLSGALAVILCGIGIWYYRQTPPTLRMAISYIGIFMDLLPNSDTPREDLQAFGLNPDYVVYSGKNGYDGDSPLTIPEFRSEFLAKVHSSTLPRFYLRRPVRLYQLCQRAVPHTFTDQVARLGAYEASSGKPPQIRSPQTWDDVRWAIFPQKIWFIGLFFVSGGAALVLCIKAGSEVVRHLSALYLLFVLIGIASFFIPVLAQGIPDLEKHLWMFNLAFDTCFIIGVLGFAYWLSSLKSFKVLRKARTVPVTKEATDRVTLS